jgi:transcriptional regulator MraZ
MFVGEYLHNVDTKGRVAIPARFRAKIERGAVLTRGMDSCLTVYPMETWERKAQALDNIADPRKRHAVERQFFAAAFEVELDAQGRIVIPPKLRKYAGLNGEAMIIGARDRFEIWSGERWQSYLDELAAEDLSELALPF